MGIFKKQKYKVAKSAKLMGVRTAVESEFHLIGQIDVNYSVYCFFVEYVDGTSGTEEVASNAPNGTSEEKARFQQLMRLSNEAENKASQSTAEVSTSSSAMDELKKLKDLYDDGVVPEEVYLANREKLLASLSETTAEEPSPVKFNIQIDRVNRPNSGEAKTVLYIDDEKRNDVDLKTSVALSLSRGHHTIQFRRATVKSNTIEFDVIGSEKYYISFAPKTFTIETTITKS